MQNYLKKNSTTSPNLINNYVLNNPVNNPINLINNNSPLLINANSNSNSNNNEANKSNRSSNVSGNSNSAPNTSNAENTLIVAGSTIPNVPNMPSFMTMNKDLKTPDSPSKEKTGSADAKKKKKPFVERVGDWVCIKCKNLNFSFRLICNRCQLTKIESEKLFEQYMKNLMNYVKLNEMLQNQIVNTNNNPQQNNNNNQQQISQQQNNLQNNLQNYYNANNKAMNINANLMNNTKMNMNNMNNNNIFSSNYSTDGSNPNMFSSANCDTYFSEENINGNSSTK